MFKFLKKFDDTIDDMFEIDYDRDVSSVPKYEIEEDSAVDKMWDHVIFRLDKLEEKIDQLLRDQ